MSAKQLLILPHGKRLDEAQAKELSDAGFIVVYLKDPSQARLINAEAPSIQPGQLLFAALKGLREGDSYISYRKFVDFLLLAMKDGAP